MKKTLKTGWPLKFLSVLIVPLQSADNWKILEFNKIPAHEVKFSDSGLHVQVKKSAAPIIYPLSSLRQVQAIRVKGKITGPLRLKGPQGEKGDDDYVLRVGLVISGDKKLNFIQRRIAPQWVLELHALAPEGSGVDRIEFFNITNSQSQLGKSRVHPLSNLLKENFTWYQPVEGGEFSFETRLPEPLSVLGIWISIDGDDTKSEFTTELTSLILD